MRKNLVPPSLPSLPEGLGTELTRGQTPSTGVIHENELSTLNCLNLTQSLSLKKVDTQSCKYASVCVKKEIFFFKSLLVNTHISPLETFKINLGLPFIINFVNYFPNFVLS